MLIVDLYKGSFVGDKIEGFGVYISPSGVTYEGGCKEKKPSGNCLAFWVEGPLGERNSKPPLPRWLQVQGTRMARSQTHGQCYLNHLDGSFLHTIDEETTNDAV